MQYLGVELIKPKAAFFDFSCCEGCQLQIANNENKLLDFISLVEVVNFREILTERNNDYDIAFIEGSITRKDEIDRLKKIREKAKILVAFGTCASFGGINKLKNKFKDIEWVKKEVYGNCPIETNDKVMAVNEVVKVDFYIYGCPVNKSEVEAIVQSIALGREFRYLKHPVCFRCKEKQNICLYEMGKICMGPLTRAGCGARCPSNGNSCIGCRGPAEEPNIEFMKTIMIKNGFTERQIRDKFELFSAFKE
ncbi:MAG: NADH:ubiquinone oxidoreductase [bacterium]|nr:NADH:ubiquinone oxidoreductase [bacterium]